jgi:CRISPR-associated endonuclease/helicase Cas3
LIQRNIGQKKFWPNWSVPRSGGASHWQLVGTMSARRCRRRGDGSTERPFQEMLLAADTPQCGHPRNDVLYAKSNRRGAKGAGFRQEVASALAYLEVEEQPDDLVAYLIMCHHGKVRLLPEPWDENRMNDADGVRPDVTGLRGGPVHVSRLSSRSLSSFP